MALIEVWLLSRSASGRSACRSFIRTFDAWLKEQGHFQSLDEAVKFQEEAVGRARFRVVDLAIAHVKMKGGTWKGMNTRFDALRSFFLFHRVELPKVRVHFEPTRDTTRGRLTLKIFVSLVRASGLRDQAIYLTLLQGFMDQHRFVTVFNRRGYELSQHIKEQGSQKPFRVDLLRGRKTNPHPFNSWLGHEALEAWKAYFDRIRGWPQPGEAAALDREGKPITHKAMYESHLRRLRKLRYITSVGDKYTRYGLGEHDIRDLAISLVEKAKPDGFNDLSAEFWAGHSVDPSFYRRVWDLDPTYNLEQFAMAEKQLNVISGPIDQETERQKEQIATLQKEIQTLHSKMNQITNMLPQKTEETELPTVQTKSRQQTH